MDAWQSEILRLEGTAGVLLQTGVAVTAATVTVAATVPVPADVDGVLIATSFFSWIATLLAALSLYYSPSSTELLACNKAKARKKYRLKRLRCRLALWILMLTIEIAILVIATMLVT